MIRIGDKPPAPEGYKTAVIEGKDPYERAAAIDRFFSAAKGKPSTTWWSPRGEQRRVRDAGRRLGRALGRLRAARPSEDAVPPPTAKALREHEKPNIFLLGPEA